MVRATFLEERRTWEERARPARQAGATCFRWSLAKLRIAALVLLGAATPAILGFAMAGPFVRWICLAWLAGIALIAQGLSRRARAGAVVLSVHERGIFDRRLMSRHIDWQEIAAIWPVNIDRSNVVDIELRWPKITLGRTRWSARIGAYCQTGYGVPAVTISMLLLEGNVSEVLNAVAQHRPDLLHHTNRRGALTANQEARPQVKPRQSSSYRR
jgi:hypothetical protein